MAKRTNDIAANSITAAHVESSSIKARNGVIEGNGTALATSAGINGMFYVLESPEEIKEIRRTSQHEDHIELTILGRYDAPHASMQEDRPIFVAYLDIVAMEVLPAAFMNSISSGG